MTVDNNTLEFTYGADGRPMTVRYNGTLYYYATNLQGDVVAILDGDGVKVVSYGYDAWGAPVTIGGDMYATLGRDNPLRYRGYVYDRETKLYYLQSRYYDPYIGRFISPDAYASTGQGILGYNMFAYCNNNPVNFLDQTGELMFGVDFINRPGGPLSSPSGALPSSQDIANSGYRYSPGKREIGELVQDVIEIIQEFRSLPDKYPQLNVYLGGKDINKGINMVLKGVDNLFSPISTTITDLIGVGLITYGILLGAGGLVKMLIGLIVKPGNRGD